NELIDTAFAVEDRAGVALGPVVVNGCLDAPPDDFEFSPAAIQRDATALDRFVSEREAHDLSRAAAFRSERYEIQLEQAERLSSRLPLPQLRLPFVFDADITRDDLGVLAAALTLEIEALPAR
ncbi:MAG: hypothetical protein QOI55_2320, partial [Actinomycetota bacterium]|nr:hypothetical protein [Actinomycetota bacterium]